MDSWGTKNGKCGSGRGCVVGQNVPKMGFFGLGRCILGQKRPYFRHKKSNNPLIFEAYR